MSSGDRSEARGGRVGTIVLAAMLGVGVGLLAAPQAGSDTRRNLKKRLAAARAGLEDELDELEERSRPARRAVRNRAQELGRAGKKRYDAALEQLEDRIDDLDLTDDDEDSGGGLTTALTVGAGLAAAAYFFSSERAAPARERVREAAATVRDEAEARWDRFQQRRGNGHPGSEGGDRSDASSSGSQPS
jgi:gas vesicle protein